MTELATLVEAIKLEGAAIVYAFAPWRQLMALRAEWAWVLPARANYRYGYGLCARYSFSDLPRSLTATADLFSDDSLPRQIFDALLGHQQGYMEVVAFTHEFRDDSHEIYGRLHFDRKRQLKFILYLDDTSDDDGAFRYIPGSTAIGRSLRQSRWSAALDLQKADGDDVDKKSGQVAESGIAYAEFDCSVSSQDLANQGDLRNEIILAGSAGSLVVFDTDVLHRGGLVRAGHSRRSIKGHCFQEPQSPGKAWQESPRCTMR
jgi:hypothetical protein